MTPPHGLQPSVCGPTSLIYMLQTKYRPSASRRSSMTLQTLVFHFFCDETSSGPQCGQGCQGRFFEKKPMALIVYGRHPSAGEKKPTRRVADLCVPASARVHPCSASIRHQSSVAGHRVHGPENAAAFGVVQKEKWSYRTLGPRLMGGWRPLQLGSHRVGRSRCLELAWFGWQISWPSAANHRRESQTDQQTYLA